MIDFFDVIDKDKFNDIFRDTSGFEPVSVEQACNDPGHQVPMNLFVPPNQQYRHVCPCCGHTIMIGGTAILYQ